MAPTHGVVETEIQIAIGPLGEECYYRSCLAGDSCGPTCEEIPRAGPYFEEDWFRGSGQKDDAWTPCYAVPR